MPILVHLTPAKNVKRIMFLNRERDVKSLFRCDCLGSVSSRLDAIISLCYHSLMDNKRKATLFAFLAAPFAALTAVSAANQSISHIYIVLPLIIMSFLLFLSGYYAGLSRNKNY